MERETNFYAHHTNLDLRNCLLVWKLNPQTRFFWAATNYKFNWGTLPVRWVRSDRREYSNMRSRDSRCCFSLCACVFFRLSLRMCIYTKERFVPNPLSHHGLQIQITQSRIPNVAHDENSWFRNSIIAPAFQRDRRAERREGTFCILYTSPHGKIKNRSIIASHDGDWWTHGLFVLLLMRPSGPI